MKNSVITLVCIFVLLSAKSFSFTGRAADPVLVGFPVVFYTPETRLGFGAGSLLTFKPGKDSTVRLSRIQLGTGYTQNKQFLLYIPFQVYLGKKESWYTFGEAGFYNYSYYFFGIGNSFKDYRETYRIAYPRLRFSFVKKITKDLYLGPRIWFDKYLLSSKEKGKLLDTAAIVGKNGGTSSSLGITLYFDNRDNVFYSSKGYYIEGSVQYDHPVFLSNYSYSRFTIDACAYLKLSQKQVMAFNYFSDMVNGNVPFTQLPMLGGSRRMRGYYEGRYRDNNFVTLQAEYRLELAPRWGAVGFGSVGGVSEKPAGIAINKFKPSYGMGLRFRFNKREKINIRFDAAFGTKSSGYYLSVGETF